MYGLFKREKNIPVERSEPSVALMVNGVITSAVPVEDCTPLVALALSELLDKVIPNVPVKREPSELVGI